MKAIVASGYGGSEVMRVQDVPEVEMTPRDVKVKIHAVSLNPVDWKIREGHLKNAVKLSFPWIAGQDMAGVVAEVGMRARNLKVGDKVYARVNHLKMGTMCETVTVEKTDVCKMPETLSFEEAASLPLVALTAWQVLVEIMQVKKDDSIFIQSGSGGVGTFAIQLAKHLGAHVTTTSSEANHALLKELGADEVIDYHAENYTERGPIFDHVFAVLGDKELLNAFNVVKPGGMVVGITGYPDDDYAKNAGYGAIKRFFLKRMNKAVMAAATAANATYRFHALYPSEAQLRTIAGLVDEGAIKPVIDSVFSMGDFAKAFEKLEDGHARGKIVLRIAEDESEQN